LSSARDKSSLSTVYILVPPGPIRHTCLVTLAGLRRRLRRRRLPASLLGKSVSAPHNLMSFTTNYFVFGFCVNPGLKAFI
jgi:hypothetical protein